jgi:hypothetical protein
LAIALQYADRGDGRVRQRRLASSWGFLGKGFHALPGYEMTIPKHIQIGGLRVKIVIVENLEDFGSFSLDDLTISLRKGDIKEMIDTLRHEMMHAAFAIGGIAHCKPFEEVEEGVVRCLDHLFFPAWGRLQQTKTKK